MNNENTVTHYVYVITELSTSMKYIGVRSCKILPEHDLGIKYFSSSRNKDFIKNQKDCKKKNIINYKYEILSVHDTRKSACNEEIRLHELYNVDHDCMFYNRTKAASIGFDSHGKIYVENKNGDCLYLNVNDPRILSGEYTCRFKNKIRCYDKDGNLVYTSTDDERIKNGELLVFSKNKVSVIDLESGITFSVDKNHPDFLSGKLVGVIKNKIMAIDVMSGKKFLVDKYDSRFESGEILDYKKHYRCMKDCNGNKYLVLKTDERIKTHELVGLSAKKIEVDGILYNSIGHVIFNLNVTKKIVTNRCKSDKWPTWNVIDHVY